MVIKNKIKFTIANNLKNIRATLNVNQQKFADMLNKYLFECGIKANYTNKNISDWESGTSIPQIETLIAISKRFNVSLDEFLKDKLTDFENILVKVNQNSIYDKFKDNKDVFCCKAGKQIGCWNENKYKFGKLSYLADNLIKYKSSFSKNFSVIKPEQKVAIITGILDVNDGKNDVHFLGNDKNDIVDIENLPQNYQYYCCDENSECQKIFYDEIGSLNPTFIVKLGDGKKYYLSQNDISNNYNLDDYKFTKDLYPKDKDSDIDDWITYLCLNKKTDISDELFDCESIGVEYYEQAKVFLAVCYGTIKINDSDLIEVLSEDYKHRLINTLLEISDDNLCNDLKKEINNYELKK